MRRGQPTRPCSGDRMNKTEIERLLAEQRDDAAQRPLHEKGVRYEDEPNALRDILDGKTEAPHRDQEIDRGISR